MSNKTTAITIHRTSEGERLAILYSTIDENGEIRATNQQKSMIILDDDVLNHIKAIEDFVNGRINQAI